MKVIISGGGHSLQIEYEQLIEFIGELCEDLVGYGGLESQAKSVKMADEFFREYFEVPQP